MKLTTEERTEERAVVSLHEQGDGVEVVVRDAHGKTWYVVKLMNSGELYKFAGLTGSPFATEGERGEIKDWRDRR